MERQKRPDYVIYRKTVMIGLTDFATRKKILIRENGSIYDLARRFNVEDSRLMQQAIDGELRDEAVFNQIRDRLKSPIAPEE